MTGLVLAGLCALSLVLAVALILACRALVGARTHLALEEARRGDREALDEARRQALDAQRESLRNEFGELAARLLSEKQRSLAETNEQSVSVLFARLKEKLDKYEEEIGKSAGENARLGEHMKSQLAALQGFADEARAFTAALVGGNKIQGNQGEAILAGILERSGLREGTHYDMQRGGRDEGRPDVSVYDARSRRVLLIDSKMNIKDYIFACGLPDDDAHKAEKARALKAHAASVKKQIDGLAAKNYARTVAPKDGYENLPLVAMFCPFDAVLEAALDADPSLMQYAYEKSIVIVTPLTLWGYFWLVSWSWRQHAVENQFAEIRQLGGEVLAAADAVLDDLAGVGAALDKAKDRFESLKKRLTEEKGRASIRRVATSLMACGVAPPAKAKQLGNLAAPDASLAPARD